MTSQYPANTVGHLIEEMTTAQNNYILAIKAQHRRPRADELVAMTMAGVVAEVYTSLGESKFQDRARVILDPLDRKTICFLEQKILAVFQINEKGDIIPTDLYSD